MADGDARAGGDIGTALVVPGPGPPNAAAGLCTAYAASSPVLMISGQIPRGCIGRNTGLLQTEEVAHAPRALTRFLRGR